MEHKTIHPTARPTDYDYALLSQHAYQGEALKPNQRVPKKTDWRVHETLLDQPSAYFGVIFVNDDTKQMVLAHRGTNTLASLVEDAKGIYFNQLSPHKEHVFLFTQVAVNLLKKKKGYHLSFTGHSLGAFLAELSVYYCHRSFECPQVSALTFESPGSYDSLLALQPNHPQGEVDLNALDMVSYLSYPNLVNTCNRHVGTLYSLEPDLGDSGWIPGWYTKQAHSLDAIVQLLEDPTQTFPYIQDWSVGTTLIPGGWSERDYFFKYARFENGQYRLPEEKVNALTQHMQASTANQHFELDFKAHYQLHPKFHHQNMLPLIHFSQEAGDWLQAFYKCYQLYTQAYGQEGVLTHLSQCVKEKGISEEVFGALMAVQLLDRYGKKSVYTAVQDANVFDLRKNISTWLVNHPEQAVQLLSFVMHFGKEMSEVPDIQTLIREDVTIKEGAIVQGEAAGIYTAFPEGADKSVIENLNTLVGYQLEKIKALGIKIKVVGMKGGAVEAGAHVTDHVYGIASRAEPRITPHPYAPLFPSPKATSGQLHSTTVSSPTNPKT